MSDKTILQLVELGSLADGDLLPIWDLSSAYTKSLPISTLSAKLLLDVDALYQPIDEKDAASGYCGLDSSTKVPTALLGSGTASSTTFLSGDRSWKAITALDASVITSGTIGTARLGSGLASATSFLRGDSSWVDITATVDTYGTPLYGEFARFRDSNTIEGRSASEARTELGLEIGTNVQAHSDRLDEIDNISPLEDMFIVGYDGSWTPMRWTQARAALELGSSALLERGHTYSEDGEYFFEAGEGCKIEVNETGDELYFKYWNGASWDSWLLNVVSTSGFVDISGTPTSGQFARFTDANTIQGIDASAVRSALGLVVGTHVQAYSNQLLQISLMSPTDGDFIVGDSSGYWVRESAATARTSLGLGTVAVLAVEDPLTDSANIPTSAAIIDYGDAHWGATGYVAISGTPVDDDIAVFTDGSTVEGLSKSEFLAAIDMEIGTDVQAYSVKLADIVALAVTDGNIIVANGTTWVAESGATARTSLGLGSVATLDAEETLMADNGDVPTGAAIIAYGDANWGAVGYINTSGTPEDDDVAIFTDADTVEGLSYSEFRTAAGVQAQSTYLDAIAALAVTDGNFIVGNGSTWVAESGATVRTSLGLGSAATRAAEDTLTDGSNLPDGAAIIAYGDAHWGTGIGYVDISGTPTVGQYAKFTDANTVEGATLGSIITKDAGHGYGSGGHYYFETGEDASIYLVSGDLFYRYNDGGWTYYNISKPDKIIEGNSYLEAVDAGVGYFQTYIDAIQVMKMSADVTLELGYPRASVNTCVWRTKDSSFASAAASGSQHLNVVNSTPTTAKAAVWLDKNYTGQYTSAKTLIPTCIYAQTVATGAANTIDAPMGIVSVIRNESSGSGDAVAIAGRVEKTGSGSSDSCGVWGSAYRTTASDGGIMALEGSIYNSGADVAAKDALGWNSTLTGLENKWSTACHLQSHSTNSPALAGLAIDGVGATGTYYGFWNAILIDSTAFRYGTGYSAGQAGTVGINLGACRNSGETSLGWPEIGIKFGKATYHLYSKYDALTFYDPIAGTKTLSQLVSASAGGSDTQIQYNSGGALTGSSSLTWSLNTLRTTNLYVNGTVSFASGSVVSGSNISATFANLTAAVHYINSNQAINSNGSDIVINNNYSGSWKYWNFQSNGNLRMMSPSVPASISSSGNTGEICWSGGYIYVCIAPNTWRRVALSTF